VTEKGNEVSEGNILSEDGKGNTIQKIEKIRTAIINRRKRKGKKNINEKKIL